MRIEPLEPRRLLSAGDQDMSFGVGGRVPLDVLNAPAPALLAADATGIASNKVIDVGQNQLERRNPDGSIDTTFGNNGTVTTFDIGTTSALPESSGQLLLLGNNSLSTPDTLGSDSYLLRFSSNGVPDASFGQNGKVDASLAIQAVEPRDGTGVGTSVRAMAVQPDGKIIVWAEVDLGPVKLYRFNTDGMFDPTFSFGPSVDAKASNVANAYIGVQPDGKLLLTVETSSGSSQTSLVRLNPDGSVDTTFGTNGYVPDVGVDGIFIQTDNKIVVAFTNFPMFGARRFNSDGSVDTSYGQNGTIEIAENSQGVTNVNVSPTADGKLVLWSTWEVIRLTSDGTVDTSFGRVFSYSDGQDHRSIDGVVAQPDGRLLLSAYDWAGDQENLYRLGNESDPAGQLSLSNGVLHFEGTDGADVVNFNPSDESNQATIEAVYRGGFGRIYPAADVTSISASLGAGDDELFVGYYTNVLSIPVNANGGDGNDHLSGGDGNDTLSGGEGADSIYGGNGDDLLNGDGGKDYIKGQGGNDTIFGGAGADRIYGGDGDDQIFGQGGNDWLSGGPGRDTLHGNAGNDTFLSSADGSVDQLFGDRGSDTALADPTDALTGIESVA